MCTVLLPPGVNSIAVNRCINISTNNTTCKLPEDGALTPKHVGVILN